MMFTKSLLPSLLLFIVACGRTTDNDSPSTLDNDYEVSEAGTGYLNTGKVCLIREENLGDELNPEGADPILPLEAGMRLIMRVILEECESSCAEIETASCEVTVQGNEIHVQAEARVKHPTGENIDCPTECQVIETVCYVPALPSEGTYQITYGEKTYPVEVPGFSSCDKEFRYGECSYPSDYSVNVAYISIRNNTDADLFLMETPEESNGKVVTADGAEYTLELRECIRSCNFPEVEDCGQGYPRSAIRIVPGGTFSRLWHGGYEKYRTFPASCNEGEMEVACIQRIIPSLGDSIRFDAVTAVSCNSEIGDESCTCTPDSNGSCTIHEATSQEPITFSGSVTILEEASIDGYVVELVPISL